MSLPPSSTSSTTQVVTILNAWHIGIQQSALTISDPIHCSVGQELVMDYYNEPNLLSSQQFRLHHDGLIESVACPGLYLDVSGNNCNNDKFILYPLKSREEPHPNQVWDTQEDEDYFDTTNHSTYFYDPAYTIHSDLCPQQQLSSTTFGNPSTLTFDSNEYYTRYWFFV